jgi:hypothetical protein
VKIDFEIFAAALFYRFQKHNYLCVSATVVVVVVFGAGKSMLNGIFFHVPRHKL